MSFPAFYSVVTLLRNAMVISTWLCHTEPLALPSSVCARVLNHHASAHSLPLSFSVGWRGKAFADFQGSLSAYPPSKSVAAPRSKQSAKRRTKESVAGDLVVRMMMIIPAEEIPFNIWNVHPFARKLAQKWAPELALLLGPTTGQNTVKQFEEKEKTPRN